MNEELHANRKHKDTVFRMLYSDKRAILELYNALNGTGYQNPDDLTVTTLENAVYMAMKNDVSFLLDARMTLYEHQSTWNPNMPLRDLLYIARLMEKNVNKKSLYQSEMIKLPAPPFCGILQREGEKTGGHNHKAVGCLFAEGRGTGAGTEGPVSEYQSGMQSGTDEKVQDTERIQ